MDLYARVRTNIQSWARDTPFPPVDSKSSPKFQCWHHFHQSLQQWVPTTSNDTDDHSEPPRHDNSPSVLLTWNIDANPNRTEDRVTEIISFIVQMDPKVHIVFLQEVSGAALHQILRDERIRESWYSSTGDDKSWGKQSFSTMTLLSKARFESAALGPIWRVAYPSYFGRDALCCDIFAPERVRLINVHLDSLAIRPSHRPQQISIVSSFLRSAGRGLVAGDFNPVLDEDATLLESNGLEDVWAALHPDDPGYTWGTDGKARFPPNRMDKVATVGGINPHDIKTLEPKRLPVLEGDQRNSQSSSTEDTPPWSDHHGLLCTFGLWGARNTPWPQDGFRPTSS